MMKLNLQLFAHKKGMGSTRNGRDSESKRLGPKRAMVSSLRLATFLFVSAAPRFIPVRTWASARTTPCSRW